MRRYLGAAFMGAAAIVLFWLGVTAFRFLLAGLLAACLVMAAALWWIHRHTNARQDELLRDLLNRRGLKGR